MRSMMLCTLLLAGCACCKKNQEQPPIIIREIPPVEQTPIREFPPFPSDNPQPKVKVTDVVPILPEPPISVPEFAEPQIKIPLEGRPYLIKDRKAKVYLIESPPYNGLPNVGCELLFNW